ncbi:MAG: hypothetical protein HQL74_12995 [Magnetococcales bacterium]|nr:hypothetical protein [Magnetococcales bacterium]
MKATLTDHASNSPALVETAPKKSLQKESYWDEKITEQRFYDEDVRFDNTEVDMYDVKPWRVKIVTDA